MWPKLKRIARTRDRSFRPRLLALEDRTCPSGALQWTESLPANALRSVAATTIQPDGKIVLVGQAWVLVGHGPNTYYVSALGISRLNPNGSLDTTFNGTGTATLRVNSSDTSGTSVALQPNGKIVVGGNGFVTTRTRGQYSTSAEYVVARFNANGTLDGLFGNNGVFAYDPGPSDDTVRGLAVLPNGTILVGGQQQAAFNGPAQPSQIVAFELTSAGALNTAFGSGGLTAVQVGDGCYEYGMAVVPGTGQIVLAGSAYQQSASYGCIVTLTAAGRLDPSFNGTGSVIATSPGSFNSVAIQGSAAAGYKLVLPGGNSVTRYTLTGAVDPSFGGAGTGSLAIGNGHAFSSIAVAADESIIVGGLQRYLAGDGAYHYRMAVGHVSADGIVDTSFGPNGTGFSYAQVGINSKSFYALALDPLTGDIVLGGFTQDSASVPPLGP